MKKMKNKIQKRKNVLGVLLSICLIIPVVLFSLPFFTQSAGASSTEEVMQKTLVNAMRDCYATRAVKSTIDAGDVGSSHYGINLYNLVKDDGNFILPTDIGNSLGKSGISCQDVFVGKGNKMNSIYSFFGKSQPTNLEQMGYTAASGAGSSDYKCVYLRYYLRTGNTGREYNTNSICMPVENGKIVLANAAADIREENNEDMAVDSAGNFLSGALQLYLSDGGYSISAWTVDQSNFQWPFIGPIATLSNGDNFSDLVSETNNAAKYIATSNPDTGNIYSTAFGEETKISAEQRNSDSGVLSSSMELDSNSATRALQWLAGDSASLDDYKFNDSDWYFIYRTYIDRVASEGQISINSDCNPGNHEQLYTITYDGVNWCIVENAANVTGDFGVKKNNSLLKLGSFIDVLEGMDSLDFSKVDPALLGGQPGSSIGNGTGTDSGGNEEEGSSEINCFTDGSSLGWILCPTLEILSNAVNGMYDEIADNWLEIGSGEMSDGGGVYEGWTKFRDLANIVFVIILLVVIFSQVTGLGLTNYGVKKVLPTLVMVAVLVNISFILCQLAVDVTNILGDSLKSTFEGMKLSSGSGFGLSDIVTGIASGILHLAVAGGATALFVTYSGGFGMLLVPFLLVLISSLIGTVVFFLSLAIRKAGIFVMIVLCPVAIVCYALPNTKRFFDKWMKLFMGLMMVYPICGILMGGGKFFSSVLLTSGDTSFFMALTAMLIQVVPFFFIPSLVKGSLNVMGNIGTKLSGLGSRITRGTQGTLSRSRWAQDRQQRLMRDSNLRRDTRLANRGQKLLSALEAKRDANGGVLSKRDQRRYRRAEYETARAASRFRRTVAEDAQASYDAARGLPTEGSIQYMNMMDTLRNSADAKELEEWGAALLNGHMDYTDNSGNTHMIDVNNLGKLDVNGSQISPESPETSLSSAFTYYLDAYDNAEDGSEEQKIAGIKARAIANRLLEAGGDNGQTIVTTALRSRKFDANGDPLSRSQTKSVDAMSEYIARNGKWMGQIKKTDTGSFTFLNDAANKTASFKTRAEYHTMGDKKVTAAAIPGLSDGFFEGFKQEINTTDANGNTIFDTNNEAAQRLLDIDDAAQRALSDERISNEMKPETIEYLEAIHQKAYKVRQKRWLEGRDSSGVDNIKQLHGFNTAGREIEAAGKDTNGFLLDNAGNRLLDAAGGSPLTAEDAYSRQIRRYVKYESGKRPTSGEIKILRKKEMPDHWIYDNNAGKWKMIDISRGINRDLTPEEAERAKNITKYNAEVEQLNTENNLNP